MLMDKDNKCKPLYWTSYKAKRVTRSVLGSEVMAFADAFDMAYTIKYNLQAMMRKGIPLTMLTDSLSLFHELTKATVTTEKGLMIDLQNVKESYRNIEINNVAFILSEQNLADTFTKLNNNIQLMTAVRFGTISDPIQQWIIRNALLNDENNDDLIDKAGSVNTSCISNIYLSIWK